MTNKPPIQIPAPCNLFATPATLADIHKWIHQLPAENQVIAWTVHYITVNYLHASGSIIDLNRNNKTTEEYES